MHLHRSSPAGRRFFESLLRGTSLKRSARVSGVGKETARRWTREAFDELRADGFSMSQAQVTLGFVSSLMPAWDEARLQAGDNRHHRRRPVGTEAAFWSAFEAGMTPSVAAGMVGVGRSTSYRWLNRRFLELREDHVAVTAAARSLRLDDERAKRWEQERRQALGRAERAARAARHDAVVTSARHAQALLQPRAAVAKQARHARYWELVGQGHSNTEACTIMRLHPRTGRNIRRRGNPSTHPDQSSGTGRYLTLHERLQIADLLGHDITLRAIAAELGRSTSTISRELDRHRDQHGRYQPYQAEQAAARQRLRPRQSKLVNDEQLRQVVQRKLNRYWSPEQIAGWLRTTRLHEAGRTVCAETIYRALIVPGARCLHHRYTAKLRTGRRLRRSHHITQSRKDGAVRNMTSIRDRPEEVSARVEPGHWESQWCCQAA